VGLNSFGRVTHSEGDYASAQSYCHRSLTIAEEVSDKWMLAVTLSDLAVLAAAEKAVDRAACLWGAAQRLRGETGAAVLPVDRVDYERSLEVARGQLGERAFLAALAAGRSMSLQEAAAYALGTASTDEDILTKALSAQPAPPRPAGLTPREVEVLSLVAQGMTDAQVAEELVISPRTVNAHLTSIYSKLYVNSRVAATLVAQEHGLV
jgi:non-specific serine/threonine protein kinase